MQRLPWCQKVIIRSPVEINYNINRSAQDADFNHYILTEDTMEKFEDLKDKTIVEITGNVGDEEMVFKTEEGGSYKLYHYQD